MYTVDQVLEMLRAKARPDQLEGMSRYGMATKKRLGVPVPDMRAIAKQIGKDHNLALTLWETGVAEARPVLFEYRSGDFSVIKEGLAEGDLVVVETQEKLKDKMSVIITEVQEQFL